jgi:NADH:ubiquinone oxidoreductase subunit 6 (subunit J)
MIDQKDFFLLLFVFFSTIASICIFLLPNLIYSLISLIFLFIFVSCLFLLIGAEFIAFSYILLYVGAVLVLFLWVIMTVPVKHKVLFNFKFFFLTAFAIIMFIIYIANIKLPIYGLKHAPNSDLFTFLCGILRDMFDLNITILANGSELFTYTSSDYKFLTTIYILRNAKYISSFMSIDYYLPEYFNNFRLGYYFHILTYQPIITNYHQIANPAFFMHLFNNPNSYSPINFYDKFNDVYRPLLMYGRDFPEFMQETIFWAMCEGKVIIPIYEDNKLVQLLVPSNIDYNNFNFSKPNPYNDLLNDFNANLFGQLGYVFYTKCFIQLIIIGLILLVSMVGSISLLRFNLYHTYSK